jgi:hypothetical protein
VEPEPPEIPDEIDLEALFYPPPNSISPFTQKDRAQQPTNELNVPLRANDLADEFAADEDLVLPVPMGPSSNPPTVSNTPSDSSNDPPGKEAGQINSLHAYRDLSRTFRDSLKSKKEKMITFFLSKHDQYVKLPPGESEID